MSVRPSGIPDAGLGLFADTKFRCGDIITYYDGHWLTRREAEALASKTHLRTLSSSYSAIDGLRTPIPGRGGASFANDGRDALCNNSTFHTWILNGKAGEPDPIFPELNLVVLRAKRDINMGEEILVSYGRQYWRRVGGTI